MGPLVYTSGNDGYPTPESLDRLRLQWGRWFTPAETFSLGSPLASQSKLQWGRWFTPAETRADREMGLK